ncbi:MAG: DUF488 family protein [Desulfurococcaceae archaeon]
MKVVYTIGYGGRSIVDFAELLKYFEIEVVVDVRRWNKSIKFPVFSGSNLRTELGRKNIQYIWIPHLGGYRKFGVDVEDVGIASCFKSEGFRAYATYITRCGNVKPYLDKLVEIADRKKVAIMCSEKYPWFCHRKILSDYMVARGFKVLHIIEQNYVVEHELSKCAVIENNELKYI